MARLINYGDDANIMGSDRLIGSDGATKATKNFTVQALADFVGGIRSTGATIKPGGFTISEAVPDPATNTHVFTVTIIYYDPDNLDADGVPIETPESVMFRVPTKASTLRYGAGAPTTSTTGNQGDFYLDTNTTTLYGPKPGVSSPFPTPGVSLIGPRGPEGPEGPVSEVPGPRGPEGPEGPVSTTPGPRGPKGEDSEVPGPQGPAGPEGPYSLDLYQATASSVDPATLDAPSGSLEYNISNDSFDSGTIAPWSRETTHGSTQTLWVIRYRVVPSANPDNTVTITQNEWSEPFAAGQQGIPGEQGPAGDGYTNFQVSADGDLTVTGTGNNADVGPVNIKGTTGTAGVGIASINIGNPDANRNKDVVINYTQGQASQTITDAIQDGEDGSSATIALTGTAEPSTYTGAAITEDPSSTSTDRVYVAHIRQGDTGPQGLQGIFTVTLYFPSTGVAPLAPEGVSWSVGSTEFLNIPNHWYDSFSTAQEQRFPVVFASEAMVDYSVGGATIPLTFDAPFEIGAAGPEGDTGPEGAQGISRIELYHNGTAAVPVGVVLDTETFGLSNTGTWSTDFNATQTAANAASNSVFLTFALVNPAAFAGASTFTVPTANWASPFPASAVGATGPSGAKGDPGDDGVIWYSEPNQGRPVDNSDIANNNGDMWLVTMDDLATADDDIGDVYIASSVNAAGTTTTWMRTGSIRGDVGRNGLDATIIVQEDDAVRSSAQNTLNFEGPLTVTPESDKTTIVVDVVPNPGSTTIALTSLNIGGVNYKITNGGGTPVVTTDSAYVGVFPSDPGAFVDTGASGMAVVSGAAHDGQVIFLDFDDSTSSPAADQYGVVDLPNNLVTGNNVRFLFGAAASGPFFFQAEGVGTHAGSTYTSYVIGFAEDTYVQIHIT